MFTNKKIAFTLVELIMVIAIIWILMLWMTVYLWNGHDRATSIEAEWCSNALWWALSNYVFYTLTSRNLRIIKPGQPDETVSPTYYYVELTGGTTDSTHGCSAQNAFSWYLCKQVILWYATGYASWDYDPDLNRLEYETLEVSNTCRHWKPNLWFYRSWWQFSWDIEFIRMNKWFTPREVRAERVFFLKDKNWTTEDNKKPLIWDIIVVLCEDEQCSCTNEWCSRKQIGKRHVDARSQTISFKKCRYYHDGTDWNICKTREDCMVYNSEDPTICEKY